MKPKDICSNGLRFTELAIDRAMERLHMTGEKGRAEVVRILKEWDRGFGDADDVIDEWEDGPTY